MIREIMIEYAGQKRTQTENVVQDPAEGQEEF